MTRQSGVETSVQSGLAINDFQDKLEVSMKPAHQTNLMTGVD